MREGEREMLVYMTSEIDLIFRFHALSPYFSRTYIALNNINDSIQIILMANFFSNLLPGIFRVRFCTLRTYQDVDYL